MDQGQSIVFLISRVLFFPSYLCHDALPKIPIDSPFRWLNGREALDERYQRPFCREKREETSDRGSWIMDQGSRVKERRRTNETKSKESAFHVRTRELVVEGEGVEETEAESPFLILLFFERDRRRDCLGDFAFCFVFLS